MKRPDIEAIKTKYDPQNHNHRDVGRCTMNDFHTLFDYIAELEKQNSQAIFLPCKIGDEIEVRWSPHGNRVKVELFEIQEDNIARPAIYTDEGTFDFAPGEYQVIGTQEGKTCID